MLRQLQDFLDRFQAPAVRVPSGGTGASAVQTHEVKLATAVLLVEVMCADASLGDDERRSVISSLQRKFGLDADEVTRLVELAQSHAKAAHDLHSFTSALNDRLDDAQKIAVVEAMWQVAFADGHLAAHERHILWRVADLLHVQHGAYINAKMRAQAAAGLTDAS